MLQNRLKKQGYIIGIAVFDHIVIILNDRLQDQWKSPSSIAVSFDNTIHEGTCWAL